MKSNVSGLLELAQAVYQDACARCTVNVSDLRDLLTLRSRVEHRGLSELTITLPSFAADFERSLAIGRIDSTAFPSFRKVGAMPAFLQGMLSQVFDRESGGLYERYPRSSFRVAEVVEAVRQFCLAFKKLELPCTPARTRKAMDGFVQIERDLDVYDPEPDVVADFVSVSRLLWDSALASFRLDEVTCTHGPGATADRVKGNQKYVWRHWYERLEPYFPFLEHGYQLSVSYASSLGDEGYYDIKTREPYVVEEARSPNVEFDAVAFVPSCQELPVRVTPVPKTLKGPRIIAIEPVCMQYVQQGIRSELYRLLESSEIAGGHINFSDQSLNKRMALVASADGRLATVDLSEASDRVPHGLAIRMFDGNPDLRDAIEACRSTHAKMPDGRIIGPLRKFASMGSALCFPVESMYFYTICVLARLRFANLPLTWEHCLKVSREIYIYGDDIIVPADETVFILDYLQKYNCKVNTRKTFWHGLFRESCGVDAYDGVEVTPTYIRQVHPESKRSDKALISWVSTANQFYLKGYWHSAQYMFNHIESIIGDLPYKEVQSPGLGRISFLGYRSVGRWNEKYQRFEVQALVPEPVYRTDTLEGYAALQKFLLHAQRVADDDVEPGADWSIDQWLHGSFIRTPDFVVDPFGFIGRDKHHMERSALHGVAALKRRWVPA